MIITNSSLEIETSSAAGFEFYSPYVIYLLILSFAEVIKMEFSQVCFINVRTLTNNVAKLAP